MNAVVTGGTGFLGRALLRYLVPQAESVRVLVRRPEADAMVRSLGAEPIRGDLAVPGTCAGLVRPGDIVFHTAAHVAMTGRWQDFRRTTVEGTRELLAHALAPIPQPFESTGETPVPHRPIPMPHGPTPVPHGLGDRPSAEGPRRFVYVSSASVYSPSVRGAGLGVEHAPARPAAYNFYARAKLAAERLVRDACDRAGCPWTILRLGFLYGPGNRALADGLRRLAERDRLFVVGRGDNRMATLYVDDAARAVLAGGTHARAAGGIYDVASDEPVTQRVFLEATADALGLPRPRRHVPVTLAHAAGCVADLVARLPGCNPPFSRAMIALMSADQVLKADRIREELGWRPEVGFAEGMRRTKEWHLAGAPEREGTGARKRSDGTRRSA